MREAKYLMISHVIFLWRLYEQSKNGLECIFNANLTLILLYLIGDDLGSKCSPETLVVLDVFFTRA